MIFRFQHKTPPPTTVVSNNSNSNARIGIDTFRHFVVSPPAPAPQPQPQPKSSTPTSPSEEPPLWGKSTWFLFHTLAQKVSEERFPEIRLELLNIIHMICINLPCPKCTEHAKKFWKGVNFNTIQTKEDLIRLLFDFHNMVNARKHVELFKYEELDKYNTAITKNIIYNFFYHFTKKTKNIRYLAEELHRERISIEIQKWLKNNIDSFAD